LLNLHVIAATGLMCRLDQDHIFYQWFPDGRIQLQGHVAQYSSLPSTVGCDGAPVRTKDDSSFAVSFVHCIGAPIYEAVGSQMILVKLRAGKALLS
jgi:hypothetical protein